MALIKCTECGKEVSNEAANCVNCGAKIKKPTSIATLIVAAVAAVIVVQCSMSMSKSTQPKAPPDPVAEERFQKTARIAMALKQSLRDPESLTLESAWANDDASVVCIEYRARNGFGGINKEFIISAKGKLSKEPAAWNKHCTKAVFDMKHVEYALK